MTRICSEWSGNYVVVLVIAKKRARVEEKGGRENRKRRLRGREESGKTEIIVKEKIYSLMTLW